MPDLNLKRYLTRRRPTTVVAATADPQVLAVLWARPDLVVREARTTDAVNSLLAAAQLVILEPAALQAGAVSGDYLYTALAQRRVPHIDAAGFLADPARWLAEGQAFGGAAAGLPPRLVAFTALASGGVGKTTLTLGLALAVARRARLPVAVVELTAGASGLLALLDPAGFLSDPPDAYTLATQGGEPAGWQGGRTELTVVPLTGRQGALLTGEAFAGLLARLRGSHALVVVDAGQPHALWPVVQAAADRIFVVAAADRPDTVANAQLLAGEPDDPHVTWVLNQAGRLDRLAGRLASGARPWLVLPRRPAIARYADPLPALTAAVWPGVMW
jgi:Flp pilus assembly CpaE family ATPase